MILKGENVVTKSKKVLLALHVNLVEEKYEIEHNKNVNSMDTHICHAKYCEATYIFWLLTGEYWHEVKQNYI